MDFLKSVRLTSRIFTLTKISLSTFWLAIFGLIIFQDYLFSVLKNTGFYWSEVILFNFYWLAFIPFLRIEKRIFQKIIFPKNRFYWIHLLFLSSFFCVVHILISNLFIATVSHIVFTPAHSFFRILRTSISNDLILTFLSYFLAPILFFEKKENTKIQKKDKILHTLSAKHGNRQIQIPIAQVLYFLSDKPYVSIHTKEGKFLISESLKSLEEKLDQQQFIRVHKSSIININAIQEFQSRQNGDYDVKIKNDQMIRFSRHYRKNWEHIISSST